MERQHIVGTPTVQRHEDGRNRSARTEGSNAMYSQNKYYLQATMLEEYTSVKSVGLVPGLYRLYHTPGDHKGSWAEAGWEHR